MSDLLDTQGSNMFADEPALYEERGAGRGARKYREWIDRLSQKDPASTTYRARRAQPFVTREAA